MDKRTRARELAIQGLYELDVQGSDILAHFGDFLREEESDETIRKVAKDWTSGTWSKVKECDELISGSTLKWGIERLCVVDKSILRLAVYQLKFCSDIPPRVAINEAIELAKKFSTTQSPSFVNGVLDAILKKLKGDELTG
ncbi:MAG: transcription antitermination factor NusB [Planctomycetes bacterium]|nr:transcription antitermination factor NusB [Planctomycetota bacterium]